MGEKESKYNKMGEKESKYNKMGEKESKYNKMEIWGELKIRPLIEKMSKDNEIEKKSKNNSIKDNKMKR